MSASSAVMVSDLASHRTSLVLHPSLRIFFLDDSESLDPQLPFLAEISIFYDCFVIMSFPTQKSLLSQNEDFFLYFSCPINIRFAQ